MKSSDVRDDRRAGSRLVRRELEPGDAGSGRSVVGQPASSPAPVDSCSRRLGHRQEPQDDAAWQQPSASAARAAIRDALESAVIAGVAQKQLLESGDLRYRLATGEIFDLGNDGLTRAA